MIKITGGSFGADPGSVSFQGIGVKPESWSDDEIEVIPPNAGAKLAVLLKVDVKNKADKVIGTTVFTETPPRFIPSSGPAGTILKIIGPGFGNLRGKVTIGDIAVDPTDISSWADGEVDVVVPNAGAPFKTYMPIEVIDPNGNRKDFGLFVETPNERVKQIPLLCPSDMGNKEPVPCKGPIAEITVAAPKDVYSNIADAIVQFEKGKFGFPADLVASAFGLAPAKSSFSFLPLKFKGYSLGGELQFVKQGGRIQGPLPGLVIYNVLGKRPQILPAEFVRALFLTQLFPEKVKIVKSHPKTRLLTSPHYMILDGDFVTQATTSLQNLASSDMQHETDLASPVGSSRSINNSPHLIRASFRADGLTGSGPNPKSSDSVIIADWFPQIRVEELSVKMGVDGNHWECGPWRDADEEPLNPIPGRLKKVGPEGGCVLNIKIDMQDEIERVYKHLTIAGRWFSDPFACAPADYPVSKAEPVPPKAETGVSAPLCWSGQMRWEINEDRLSHSSGPPRFQLAVPYFDPKTLPKIMLGLAGVLNVNFIEPRDKSCWCSPQDCGGAEDLDRKRCESDLDR
jgi:hypothetical protein